MGCVLAVVVHAANLHDTVSGLMPLCVAKDVFPTIIACCGDSGYRGTFEADAVKKLGVEVDIIERPKGKKWEILPKRWRVERTFAWLGNYRRLSKDYEKTVASAMAFVYLANIRILLKKIIKSL